MKERPNPRSRIGTVRSSKMDKTAVVEVVRSFKHPVYGKYVRRRVRYQAHDENNSCSEGDQVRIIACRPLSRKKRWRVAETLRKAQ
ncbi:MAG: 30S ribosomal protein S17 [Myxococcota bacterium]|jgi:small subunit ribosomal protein S17|nr:30S ribosomal protein S17 [Myxococcales bacterium]MBF94467.1 30S ribosomal protein S17 [Myxococcales bacterium]MEC7751324.1 30S ribosomal protein S17 [Myxococcota bacterium]HBU47382.1 30S ribosomal protein S17 [Myxococcales bacterium]